MPNLRKVIRYAEDTTVCGILCRNVLGYEYVKGNELMVKNFYLQPISFCLFIKNTPTQ